jgi:competence ComEA-like helix-hairpin-helix protein
MIEEVVEEAPIIQAEEELKVEEAVPEEIVEELKAELPVEVSLLEQVTHVPEAVEEAPVELVAELPEAVAGALEEEAPIEIPSLADVTEVPEAVEEAPVEPVAEATEEAVPELPSWLRDTGLFEPLEAETTWEPPVEAAPEEVAVPQVSEEAPVSQPFELVEEPFARIDLNEAGLADLEHLPGVGFTRAQAVITYRQAFGAFSSLDELANVSGFDTQLVESLKPRLSVGEALPVEAISEAIDIHQLTLIQARNALIQSDTSKALSHYTSLIQARQALPEVIQDLNEALYRFPLDIHIWEALGDAHMRAGHLQEALNAYTKAEELIR